MSRMLKIPRSLVYYKKRRNKEIETEIENKVILAFRDSRNNYGTRKIKRKLSEEGICLSRRKIGRIMIKYGLVSKYTVKQYKSHKSTCNNEPIKNEVDRNFKDRESLDVVVSDLTYVNVSGKWNYVCILIDLYNREIIGYSAGKNKNAQLVYDAFLKSRYPISDINIFHTDRGNEFKNKIIDEVLSTFNIKRSLSKKGCPYDNAVAEATFKIFKTEFANITFSDFTELECQLFDYLNWYNNHPLHGALNYMTPFNFRFSATE